jgi:hypothetical protein
VLVVDRCGAKFAEQRRVRAARGAPQIEAGQPAEAREQRLADGAGGALRERTLASLHPGRTV